ncbi:hypothetical protein H4R33_006535 [Dimargaris cristalligena]|uniref:Uncharacterized protein n=1 Tax=Dimargaris cristalligena TaxID=215637 RepID=A0A4P9ZNS9_9FUNG|nr:hypothetical protein H4R33_006535 [Dimargaris cristalligena]RKP34997.1 hypothetical protein BJ085DRAFT_40717 [Dimargaris cristalligena]|eukprot:RKP34997.1 hypothetical protein BJ085DRAFT_40717 [Dimargaris cristalligena]
MLLDTPPEVLVGTGPAVDYPCPCPYSRHRHRYDSHPYRRPVDSYPQPQLRSYYQGPPRDHRLGRSYINTINPARLAPTNPASAAVTVAPPDDLVWGTLPSDWPPFPLQHSSPPSPPMPKTPFVPPPQAQSSPFFPFTAVINDHHHDTGTDSTLWLSEPASSDDSGHSRGAAIYVGADEPLLMGNKPSAFHSGDLTTNTNTNANTAGHGTIGGYAAAINHPSTPKPPSLSPFFSLSPSPLSPTLPALSPSAMAVVDSTQKTHSPPTVPSPRSSQVEEVKSTDVSSSFAPTLAGTDTLELIALIKRLRSSSSGEASSSSPFQPPPPSLTFCRSLISRNFAGLLSSSSSSAESKPIDSETAKATLTAINGETIEPSEPYIFGSELIEKYYAKLHETQRLQADHPLVPTTVPVPGDQSAEEPDTILKVGRVFKTLIQRLGEPQLILVLDWNKVTATVELRIFSTTDKSMCSELETALPLFTSNVVLLSVVYDEATFIRTKSGLQEACAIYKAADGVKCKYIRWVSPLFL